MKAIHAKVDWNKRWANSPRLKLLVNKIPEDLVYKKKEFDNGTFWVAEKDGLVRFFWENPKNKEGYAGHTFILDTEDGEEYRLTGPWSSRSGCINIEFPDIQCLEVSITDKISAWEMGYTFYSGAVTLEFAQEVIDEMDDVELIKVYKYDDEEPYYIPRQINGCDHKIGRNDRCVHCGHKAYEPYKDGYKEIKR